MGIVELPLNSLAPAENNFAIDMPVTTMAHSRAEADFIDSAIEVHDVNLNFGSKKDPIRVLCNMSMEVARGSIYGLLGPSGCGKTSLIRCILGSLKYTSGAVKVFGQEPGSNHSPVPGVGVGYMPQDTSLFPFLTISETLHYFGKLYNMSKAQRNEQIDFLTKFLNLPNIDRVVGVLSGGQRRRVSLATALIHKPQLLILDEPTVGVDPVLRKSIWQYLVRLSQQDRITILVTTHYIEEAKDANLIGLMRGGRILEQDNPASLRRRYECPTLEDVFLRICTDEEERMMKEQELKQLTPNDQLQAVATQPDADSPLPRKGSTSSGSSGVASIPDESVQIVCRKKSALEVLPSMQYVARNSPSVSSQLGAMFGKNFLKLRRSTLYMLFQFFLPTIEVLLFCLCIGRNLQSIPLAVYDGDRSDFSFSLLHSLSTTTIHQQFYSSEEDAISAVRNGSASSAMAIYPNFSTCLQERLILMGDVDEDIMRNSTIHLYPDMSNQLMVLTVQKEVLRSFVTAGKSYLEAMGASPHLLDIPVSLEEPIYGNSDPQYSEYMAPGVILSIAFLAAVPLTTMNLVMERREGLMERNVVAGVPHFLILLSHLLSQTLILGVQVVLLMLVVFPLFSIPFHGEFIEILLLTFLQSLCGLAFGLFVASVSDNENTATMLSLGIFYPMLLLSGTVWPIEAMNDVLRFFALLLPQTIPIASMRNIISRGWNIINWDVASGFLVSVGWIIVFVILSTLIFRHRN